MMKKCLRAKLSCTPQNTRNQESKAVQVLVTKVWQTKRAGHKVAQNRGKLRKISQF